MRIYSTHPGCGKAQALTFVVIFVQQDYPAAV
jgi:hypothetical protein